MPSTPLEDKTYWANWNLYTFGEDYVIKQTCQGEKHMGMIGIYIAIENFLLSQIISGEKSILEIGALIEDIAIAYQDAIKDLYAHGCRYLQIDDTSWTYMIDDGILKKVESLGYEKEEVLEWFRRVSTRALEGRPV